MGSHDVLSSFIDVRDDTLDLVVDFLGLLDSSLLWVEFSNGPDGVSPATTTGKVGLKLACHVALAVINLSISTEVVAHPALTTILVTNVLEALILGFSEAISSRLCLVVAEEFWKISLSSISEATNVFGIVTLHVGCNSGVVVGDSLDNFFGGLPDVFSLFFVGIGRSTEFA